MVALTKTYKCQQLVRQRVSRAKVRANGKLNLDLLSRKSPRDMTEIIEWFWDRIILKDGIELRSALY